MLEKLFSAGKAEGKVIADIQKHIQTLTTAMGVFVKALEKGDKGLMAEVADLEREADSVRRDVTTHIYEGAFLPFMRPAICRFIEVVDEAFDVLEDAAFEFEFVQNRLDTEMKEDCLSAARLNHQMGEMLLIAFNSLFHGDDLREKTLAIRILEKKIDEIKFDLIRRMRQRKITDFWEGKILSDFVTALTRVSDVIEDASDFLHLINLRLR